MVFGDGGEIRFAADGTIDQAFSTNVGIGGADTIKVGAGANLVVGGAAGDLITTGTGTNVVLGDNGRILSPHSNTHPFGTLRLTLDKIFTVSDDIGGADTIKTSPVGSSSNIVLGGAKGDTIWASASVSGKTVTRGTGTNLVVGDGGEIGWVASDHTIARAFSTSTTIGGADTIYLGNGSNLVVGGAFGDTIDGGNGFNVIAGDNADIEAAPGNTFQFGAIEITLGSITTISDRIAGGNDTIRTGSGTNIVLGGSGDDGITLGSGTNLVFGDGGTVDWIGTDGDPRDIDLATSNPLE